MAIEVLGTAVFFVATRIEAQELLVGVLCQLPFATARSKARGVFCGDFGRLGRSAGQPRRSLSQGGSHCRVALGGGDVCPSPQAGHRGGIRRCKKEIAYILWRTFDAVTRGSLEGEIRGPE